MSFDKLQSVCQQSQNKVLITYLGLVSLGLRNLHNLLSAIDVAIDW